MKPLLTRCTLRVLEVGEEIVWRLTTLGEPLLDGLAAGLADSAAGGNGGFKGIFKLKQSIRKISIWGENIKQVCDMEEELVRNIHSIFLLTVDHRD